MADKRMLARTIIESDPFMNMPADSQMLYVHLNLAADDDGFVANPRTVMRMCGASEDSMKLLIAKKFVLSFQKGDDFIYLIKHWKIHNTIQKDRYKASTFRNLLREVYLDENKAYSMTPGEGKRPALPSALDTDRIQDVSSVDTDRIQTVSEPETQNRLDKNRLDKFSLDQDRKGKGEYERGNPPPADFPQSPSVEKPVEKPDLSDPDKKRERIDFFIGRLQFFEKMGYGDGECWYNMAANEGITRSEINLRKIQLEKQKEAEKK